MHKIKVVADEKIPGLSELLSPQLNLILLPLEKINQAALKDADVLIGRSVLKINQALLENTAIRLVATCSSGTDHIDKNYLIQKGITLFSAPGSNAQAVADYVLWMIAYCYKNNITIGKNAGIIGVGHVGSQVKSLLETLGFNVLLNDPPRAARESDFQSVDLEKIAECDLICVHTELTKEGFYPSYHLLSDSWWERVKENTVFINAARGAVVDTEALLRQLQKKNLYLCLDVFEYEPNVNETLIKQCLMATPHIAGHTVESFYRATEMIVEKIHQYLSLDKSCRMAFSPRGRGWPIGRMRGNAEISENSSHWYDTILQYYNFHSPLELSPKSFYTLRESHRVRHDFCAMNMLEKLK